MQKRFFKNYPIITVKDHTFVPVDIQSIGIHCYLIESQFVSNSFQQLLRFVPSERKKYTTSQTNTFINPLYLPLRKNNFNTIRMQLLDLDMNRIPFEGGVIILCLHFRPIKQM